MIRSVTLQILGDDKSARAALDWVTARGEQISHMDPTLHIGADINDLEAKLAEARAARDALVENVKDLTLLANTKPLMAQLAAANLALDKLGRRIDKPKVSVRGLLTAQAGLTALDASFEKLNHDVANFHVAFDEGDIARRLALLRVQALALEGALSGMRFGQDTNSGLVAQFHILLGEAQALRESLRDENLNVDGIAAAEAKMAMLAAEANALSKSLDDAGKSGLWSRLATLTPAKVVFGGATFATWAHLGADAAVELGAIFIPATVAMLAFAGSLAALAPTVDTIVQREKAMYIATDILGQKMPGLSGSLNDINKQYKPAVWAAWGDALTVVNNNTGTLNTLLQGSTRFVDYWAARITVDLVHGSGAFQHLLDAGRRALAVLGDISLNLGHFFMSLIQVSERTGIAQMLLGVADVLSKMLRYVGDLLQTPIGRWVGALAIGLHGVYLWGGIAASALLKIGQGVPGIKGLSKAIDDMAASALSSKNGGIPFVVSGLKGIGREADGSAKTVGILGTTMALMTQVPVVAWAGAAVIGLAALAGYLTRIPDSAGQMIQKIDQAISSAPNVSKFDVMVKSVGQLDTEMSKLARDTTANLKAAFGYVPPSGSAAFQNAADRLGLTHVQQEIKAVTQGMTNYAQNIAWIEREYHVGYAAAVGIATAANVDLTKSIDGNNKAAQIAKQEITGLMTGYEQIQTPAGIAGKNFEALAFAANDITQKVSQLNSAWDTVTKRLTDTQTSFDTFAQGLQTLSANTSDYIWHLGTLEVRAHQGKAAIDDLSAAGVNLNQAFFTEVGNLGSWADAMRASGVSSSILVKGLKAGIASLIPFAKGSKDGTDALFLLAQQADYTGKDSIAALSQWAGVKAKDALKQLKGASDAATTAASNLAGAIQNLLNVQFQQDVTKATGADRALMKWTQDIVNNQTQTRRGVADRAQLIHDLEKAGWSARDATAYVDGLTKSLGKVPSHVATTLTMQGRGTYQIAGPYTPLGPVTQGGHHARGGLLTGGIPGVDSIPILAMAGEAVVPKHLVPAMAPFLRYHGVPGFAAGGIVGNLPPSNWSAWPGNVLTQFTTDFGAAMAKSMQQSIRQAMSAFSGQSGAFSVGAAIAQAFARALLPSFGWGPGQWPPLLWLWNRESGWNANARNPGSGAAGIPQDITGNFHGGYQGQILWGLDYIRCVGHDTEILTRDGWKSHDQVQAGDETIGYDPETGNSRWARITAVHHYDSAPIMRVKTSRLDITSTPNHRWLTEKLIQPFYGGGSFRMEEMTQTDRIGSRHRVRLAADFKSDSSLPVSTREAEILGWIASDGCVSYGMNNRGGKRGKLNCTITQAKPNYVSELRDLLADIPHSEYIRPPRSGPGFHGTLEMHAFRIASSYAREMLKRSGFEDGLEAMVLQMSDEQRAAYLRGLLKGDGYHSPSGSWVFAQNDGETLDSFILAATLSGSYCHPTNSGGQKHVTMGKAFTKFITGNEVREILPEPEPVWCVTTELGSWTARQSGQVFLTGNSRYGSPGAAWAHEVAMGWYDNGGLLMPGLTLAANNTGVPEVVSPAGRYPQARGGDCYYITVQGDTDPDGAARRIHQKLREYKRHHGNLPLGLA